jgi:DNA-binding response OmpR family regulator
MFWLDSYLNGRLMYWSISEKLAPNRAAGQSVLLVVDDPKTIELLSTTLGVAGYQVGTAATVNEALGQLQDHPFDLVVLDSTQVLLRGGTPVRSPESPRRGDLVLNDTTCLARRGERALDLTPAEYRLLRHLLVNADRVLSKQQICEHVWGEDRPDSAIEKLVSRLRHKVDQEEPQLIHTRRGFGYWLG